MITQTSKEAFKSIVNRLSPKETEVHKALVVMEEATDKEISEYLGWPINCVTGRRNGLEQKNFVEECGKLMQNGRSVTLYRPTDNPEVIKRRKPRYCCMHCLGKGYLETKV